MHEEVKQQIFENISTNSELLLQADKIVHFANVMIDALKNNGKILLCGNGGSAADAQHIAAELVGRFEKDGEPLAAIALNCNVSVITSISNDFAFDIVYADQIRALGKKDDVLLAISTSGNSQSIINAINIANERDMRTLALLGKDGGKCKDLAHNVIIVPSYRTARIQESHIMIGHIICSLLEKELYE